jgi:hypothetical protein
MAEKIKRCLYFTKSEPIFKTNTNLTRGARGGADLNRTLGLRGNSCTSGALVSRVQQNQHFLSTFFGSHLHPPLFF